jgi:hypothetical protein
LPHDVARCGLAAMLGRQDVSRGDAAVRVRNSNQLRTLSPVASTAYQRYAFLESAWVSLGDEFSLSVTPWFFRAS